MQRQTQWILLGAAALGAIAISVPATAAPDRRQDYHLEEQDLGAALRAVGRASGREIMFASDLVAGKRAPGLEGSFTPEEAVDHLLEGSGLAATVRNGSILIRGREAPAVAQTVPEIDDAIIVTGSRIRGAPVASSVIRVDQDQFRNAGQTSLGDVVRSIPQSFGGGQNPGVGTNVPAASGVDIGGGSSINLRGIGSDATLTLLNGHRLSYSASRQSVDVSAIPLAAVERIEIVADGASALYGSDAVAGVANIILRRDFSGLETNVHLGSSTDGGNFRQHYGAIGGLNWTSGGFLAAYEYGSNSAIEARDRSYTAQRSPGLTLFPALHNHSAIIAGHEAITSALSFNLDGLYNRRNRNSVFPLNPAGDLNVSSGRSYARAESFAVTPSLELSLGSGWRLELNGSYGEDRVDYVVDLFFAGVKAPGGAGYYRNSARSVELGGDGSLFALPGGLAKLAFGGGYRSIDFASFKGTSSYQNVRRQQDSYYAYSELSLPLVSPEQDIAFIDSLNLSAALRYEDYPGIGDVVTPKLGLIYEPGPDLAVKASWGKSFRAPTLLQQYNPSSVTLSRAAARGGSGLPASATVLLVQGGNADLKPEQASSWSATLDLHPRALSGTRLELSYFSTRYRDRIVTPVGVLSVALSNPIYQDQISWSPGDTEKAAAIANAGTFVNAAGAPYDPLNVVAIIDNRNVNAGYQKLEGLDLLLSYRSKLGERGGNLTASVNGTYLDSEQRLSVTQPIIPLAGTLFNPPHIRARGSLSWAHGPLVLTGAANFTGAVKDMRSTPHRRVASMTTADFTMRLDTGKAAGLFSNLDISLSVLNAFNAQPSNIATTLFTDTPYDSTNYSPVGRYVGFGITKTW